MRIRGFRSFRSLRLKKVKHFPGIALSILLLSLLVYLLGWSTLLSVKSIVIDGTTRTSEINNQLKSRLTQFHIGEPLARVDVHALNRQIADLDWIESDAISRDWFHGTIHIYVVERTPIAQFTDGFGKVQLIDRTGTVFSANGSNQYPVITFSGNNNSLVNDAAIFIQNLPSDLLNNMESLAIRSQEFIQSKHMALTSGELIVRWGNNQDLAVKVKVLRSLLALPENRDAKLIDLSSPLSPIAK